MKKRLSLILVILLVIVGCSNSSSQNQGKEQYETALKSIKTTLSEVTKDNLQEKAGQINKLANDLILGTLNEENKNEEESIDILLMEIVDKTNEGDDIDIEQFKSDITNIIYEIQVNYLNKIES